MVYRLYCEHKTKEIKVKDTPKDNKTETMNPITKERQKLLDHAFVELRKAQGKMNPVFLEKIRNLVRNSPVLIEKLGLKKNDIAKPEITSKNKTKDKNLSQKDSDFEKIDQSKNMDVIAKMLEMNPDKKEIVKKLLSNK